MPPNDPWLKVRIEGESIGAGRIPVSHLLLFLSNLNKAFQRTGRILLGDNKSLHQGRQPRNLSEELALDLVLLTHGSSSAVLGFEKRQTVSPSPTMDFGVEIIEKSLAGLERLQETGEALPEGYDKGVLLAWRDAGLLFRQGIDSIHFTLNHPQAPIITQYTPQVFERIRERIKGPQTNIRTIEGRLLMADFKEHGTRCRVHPAIGDPILCLFDEEHKDEVLENILHFVRIVGEAREDQATGKISSIAIHNIERLEDMENEAAGLLPQGTPFPQSFWESPTLDELAAMQNVGPIDNVESILGGWPGDPDDGFEEKILKIRHSGIVGI